MSEYETRTTRLAIVPRGKGLYDERVTIVEIDDEGGGEFVTVKQNMVDRVGIAIDVPEWPHVRSAIDQMVSSCREPEVRNDPTT